MVIILHGDDVVASRNELERIKKENKDAEIVVFDPKGLTKTSLIYALEANSLFSLRRLVVIENFFSKKTRGEKLKEEILDYLKDQKDIDLVLWEEKGCDLRTLKKYFGSARVLEFKLPAKIFNFLDSLRPGNLKTSLLYLEETLAQNGELTFIFYLLVRQVRYLILAKDGGLGSLKKEGLADWQIKKFERQATYFTTDNLTRIYKKLLEIDTNQKTGRGSLDLKESLEFLVLGI